MLIDISSINKAILLLLLLLLFMCFQINMACEIFPVTFVFVIVAAVVAVGGCHCANGLLNQLFS